MSAEPIIRWEEWTPLPLCRESRGPRSTVFCEVPVVHHANKPHTGPHAGRGRDGRWFFWGEPAAASGEPAPHEYRPGPRRCECGEPMSNPVHELHPQDPQHTYTGGSTGHQWWGTPVCTWETGDGYRQCSRPADHPVHRTPGRTG